MGHLRQFWEKQKGSGADIREVGNAISLCIKAQIKDKGAVVNLIEALAAFTRPGDAAALKVG